MRNRENTKICVQSNADDPVMLRITYLKVRRPVNKTPKNKRSVPNFWTPKVRLILKEHKLEL